MEVVKSFILDRLFPSVVLVMSAREMLSCLDREFMRSWIMCFDTGRF